LSFKMAGQIYNKSETRVSCLSKNNYYFKTTNALQRSSNRPNFNQGEMNVAPFIARLRCQFWKLVIDFYFLNGI